MTRQVVLGAFLCAALLPGGAPDQDDAASAPATSGEILARMMEADRATTVKLRNYISIRRYILENKRLGKRAEMTVRLSYIFPGHKQFEVLAEQGSTAIRKRVFRRMLDSELQASQDDIREATRITPLNYTFKLVRSELLDGRKSFVLEAAPKTPNEFLFQGRVWVDAEDYAITKIEGSPAKNPSFWIRRISFVHRYAKFGTFWLAVSNYSTTDALVFGRTDVRIEYSNYRINEGSTGAPEDGTW